MKQIELLTKKQICHALRLSPQGYGRIFGSNDRCPVPLKTVVRRLDDCRVGLDPWTGDGLPDIESCDDVVARGNIRIDGKPVTRKRLQAACRRIKNPIPHWRIGPQTFLFPLGAVDWWASLLGSGVYVSWRHFHYGDLPFSPSKVVGG